MTADRADRGRRGLVIGVVFAIATLLFVWGALSESSDHHDTHAGSEATSEEGSHETAEQRASESGERSEADEFRPLGIDLESTPLVIAAAVVSLIVAAMVAWRPTRGWLLAVMILGLLFAVLEVAEVAHQADESNTGLLVIALGACITHALSVILAGRELVVGKRPSVSVAT